MATIKESRKTAKAEKKVRTKKFNALIGDMQESFRQADDIWQKEELAGMVVAEGEEEEEEDQE